jgi:hypothetical protein
MMKIPTIYRIASVITLSSMLLVGLRSHDLSQIAIGGERAGIEPKLHSFVPPSGQLGEDTR